MMGICIYWLSRHVILQIKNHTQLTRTVGNISKSDLTHPTLQQYILERSIWFLPGLAASVGNIAQSDLYMLADLIIHQWLFRV